MQGLPTLQNHLYQIGNSILSELKLNHFKSTLIKRQSQFYARWVIRFVGPNDSKVKLRLQTSKSRFAPSRAVPCGFSVKGYRRCSGKHAGNISCSSKSRDNSGKSWCSSYLQLHIADLIINFDAKHEFPCCALTLQANTQSHNPCSF